MPARDGKERVKADCCHRKRDRSRPASYRSHRGREAPRSSESNRSRLRSRSCVHRTSAENTSVSKVLTTAKAQSQARVHEPSPRTPSPRPKGATSKAEAKPLSPEMVHLHAEFKARFERLKKDKPRASPSSAATEASFHSRDDGVGHAKAVAESLKRPQDTSSARLNDLMANPSWAVNNPDQGSYSPNHNVAAPRPAPVHYPQWPPPQLIAPGSYAYNGPTQTSGQYPLHDLGYGLLKKVHKDQTKKKKQPQEQAHDLAKRAKERMPEASVPDVKYHLLKVVPVEKLDQAGEISPTQTTASVPNFTAHQWHSKQGHEFALQIGKIKNIALNLRDFQTTPPCLHYFHDVKEFVDVYRLGKVGDIDWALVNSADADGQSLLLKSFPALPEMWNQILKNADAAGDSKLGYEKGNLFKPRFANSNKVRPYKFTLDTMQYLRHKTGAVGVSSLGAPIVEERGIILKTGPIDQCKALELERHRKRWDPMATEVEVGADAIKSIKRMMASIGKQLPELEDLQAEADEAPDWGETSEECAEGVANKCDESGFFET